MDIINKIKYHAQTIDIHDIGFCSAKPFLNMENILNSQRTSGNYTEFEYKNICDRIYPEKLLKDAQSIIVIIEKYPAYKSKKADDTHRGIISLSARGEDYHRILKRKLTLLSDFIKANFKSECIYQVDTGPLVERAAAIRCDLGWIGKNNCFYSNKFGSFVFIGCLITNLKLNVLDNEEFKSFCGSCRKCIDSCPSRALSENGIEIKNCISYNSVTKDNFNFDILKSCNKSLYGCDVCQLACPHNHIEEEIPECSNNEIYYPTIDTILNMPNSEYTKKYKNTAIFWRSKKILKRNALIIALNINDFNYKKKLFDRIFFKESNEYLKTFLMQAFKLYDLEMYRHYRLSI